jgi:2-methylcitrate dehydratase PrpD
MSDRDPIWRFAEHVAATDYDDLPESAAAATRTFLLDTLGVGVSGSAGPWTRQLIETQRISCPGGQARVWSHGARLSAAGAAACNAYQIHNGEFDCVHEGAVVHTFTVPVAAALAWAERAGGVGGRDFLTALAVGVDVACHLGVASKSPLRFFRPATAGAFGGAAAIGRLAGFDAPTLVNAFGAVLGQLSGTMQAHTEGSPLLGMQVGFNARNAIVACDLAAGGLAAPQRVLEGPYGFFPLFEGEHALGSVLDQIGDVWRVTEVSHKPFPSGRATHAVVDACLGFRERLGLGRAGGGAVEQVTARVPPLVHHLVGRTVADDMDVNYARLCCRYVAACALLRGRVGSEDFLPDALRDPDTLDLARRVDVVVDGNPDPNALVPVTVEISLRDGSSETERVEVMYGHPARPMTRGAQLDKFRRNCEAAARPIPPEAAERVIAAVARLESLPDVSALVDDLVPGDPDPDSPPG